uniref:Reverse transcriptase domain-containing protein n=1 Tax=Trichuris muris TaxID=70415 RepID=A0A5S6QC53_TRIMR
MEQRKHSRKLISPVCEPRTQVLRYYGGQQIPIRGSLKVTAQCRSWSRLLLLLITDMSNGCNLFGRDWLPSISTYQSHFHHLESSIRVQLATQKLVQFRCQQRKDSTEANWIRYSSFHAQHSSKAGAWPRFSKARPIPLAWMDLVKKEIDHLTESGIRIPLKSSVWAAPIVVVPMSTGPLGICRDFKLSANLQLEVEHYPIPRIEEIFHKLGKAQAFTKIDLADAYLQIQLDGESKLFMVVSTPSRLYQYERLPFGAWPVLPRLFSGLWIN